MTSGFFRGDLLKGLAARVIFFLSLALLPIGLIAVIQTREIANQNAANIDLLLIAETERASNAEKLILQRAFGAADALASIIPLHRQEGSDCLDFFQTYLQANPLYQLVGFIDIGGVMRCSSAEEEFDFSDSPRFIDAVENPVRLAMSNPNGSVTGQSVIVARSPAYDGQELIGFVVISIPASAFATVKEPDLSFPPLTLLTISPNEEVLMTATPRAEALEELPADVTLSLLTTGKSVVFSSRNQAGEERVYATHSLVKDTAYSLSVWPADAPFLQPGISTRLGTLLPILMWVASLVVAFWALNRLALSHIRKLGRQMRRFAINRDLPRGALGSSVPTELRDMEAAFIRMGRSILQDEAQLEDSLREKNILLKEVHHRVKNNLQLISSIMNMQIRQAESVDTKVVLRRLQERILSLATVHKNLYQNEDLAQVDTKSLVTEIVNQIVSVGLAPGSNVEVEQHYDQLLLEADDAAPLTLLVSEALTNAIKYVPKGQAKRSIISVSVTRQEEGLARLKVFNTTGPHDMEEGTGLGSRLINAFARQLNGEVHVDEGADFHRLILDFPLPETLRETRDY